jgi:hypothetical protein
VPKNVREHQNGRDHVMPPARPRSRSEGGAPPRSLSANKRSEGRSPAGQESSADTHETTAVRTAARQQRRRRQSRRSCPKPATAGTGRPGAASRPRDREFLTVGFRPRLRPPVSRQPASISQRPSASVHQRRPSGGSQPGGTDQGGTSHAGPTKGGPATRDQPRGTSRAGRSAGLG